VTAESTALRAHRDKSWRIWMAQGARTTLRRECFDHVVVVSERHRQAVLTEFIRFYNQERPHRTLRLETPEPIDRPTTGSIRASPVLGGLHHVYGWAA
jgi:transposase InsO family protein